MNDGGVETYREFNFDCYIDIAVNSVTKKQVELVQPVRIRCYEDFAKFHEQWDKFCEDLNKSGCDPDEVYFKME